ncbi:MAG: PEP-CTERM sorting domain-containing protein [Nitrospirota bacterium]|nr:PEP-CTERM sorting domain-containing protein [Nitrospirota bacterium]
MKYYESLMKRVILFATMLFAIFLGNVPKAHANYYLIEGGGQWFNSSSGLPSADLNNTDGWNFSFDLPIPLSLSTPTNSYTINGITNSYSGSTTYQAQNFNFNYYSLPNGTTTSSETLVTVPGTFQISSNSTTTYSGGITFGNTASDNGLMFSFCTPGCQQYPNKYGPDGLVISLPSGSDVMNTTGNTLNQIYYFNDLNWSIDGGLAAANTGTLFIGIESGSIPGTSLAATPEPSTLALFGTGILLMGVMAYRRKNVAA